jgi:hypothetical protein
VDVQVVVDAGAGGPALVEPDVEAVRTVLGGERSHRPLHQLHRVAQLGDPGLDQGPV